MRVWWSVRGHSAGWLVAPSALVLVFALLVFLSLSFYLSPRVAPVVPAAYRAFDDRRADDNGAALGASPAHTAPAVHVGVVGRFASLVPSARLVVAYNAAGSRR